MLDSCVQWPLFVASVVYWHGMFGCSGNNFVEALVKLYRKVKDIETTLDDSSVSIYS